MSAELQRERGERAFLSLRSFINAQYDKALAAWSAGDRSGRFPVGTWWMRRCHADGPQRRALNLRVP